MAKTRSKVMDVPFLSMETYMKANSKIITEKDMDVSFGTMDLTTKDSGSMESCMALEN